MRVGMPRLTICAVAAILAGCGGSDKNAADPAASPKPNLIQPGAPGTASREIAVPAATPEGGGYKPVDVEFMMGMIHHHQQAVAMADWVPDRTQSTSLRVMAARMSVSQQDEMNLMRNWLKKRGVDPTDHSHKHRLMPGMINSRQFAKLEAASGKPFDRLFLRYMTQHHLGALTMVQELVDKGGGAEPELEQFIRHVDSDQTIEIQRMQQLLQGL
jgi:uncharacterized protein (DUF305 family)